ncbi:PhzF family phenazine biosynthesis protein [Chloroflexi bacterium TSY]|nr:PhzF family phenazine biosynthesis protein [Chloroflexi bacterium TSY]
MSIPIIQVDAFTNEPFRGNPAAVCLLPKAREEQWMQAVAAEMNLSETAFLVKQKDGYDLRWFTPTVEVNLCGHATLACAHVLWSEGHLPCTEVARFHTKSGLLTAQPIENDWIELNFPARETKAAAPPEGLLDALGVSATFVGRDVDDYLVEVEAPEIVHAVKPDFGELARINTRGVIVTSRSDQDEYDFISRFFGPGAGIPEDPVTGSAHCCLAPYWSEKLGKTEMIGYQASSRGGVVRVTIAGDRVLLGGQVATVLRGELRVS